MTGPRKNSPAGHEGARRFTVDLAVPMHDFLGEFASSAGVDKSDVIRELLRHLRDDDALADQIRAGMSRRLEALREARRLAQE